MNVYLVHFDPLSRNELVDHLEELGHYVHVASDSLDADLPELKRRAPEAILGYLGAAPAQVIERAQALKKKRCARSAAVLFNGGDAAAMEAAQEVFPRASFARRAVLMNALASVRG